MEEQISKKVPFGYGKDWKHVKFPDDWIKPGERKYDVSGQRIVKGKYIMFFVAVYRRFIQRLEPVFWMKQNSERKNDE